MKKLEKILIAFYCISLFLYIFNVSTNNILTLVYLGFLPIVYIILGLNLALNSLKTNHINKEPKHVFWGIFSSISLAAILLLTAVSLQNWVNSFLIFSISIVLILPVFYIIKMSKELFFRLIFWRYVWFSSGFIIVHLLQNHF